MGRAAIFGHEKDHGLQDYSRARCPCGEGGDGREEPTSQLHTFVKGKVVEEIDDILEWGGGFWVGTTRLGFVGLAAAVVALAAAFFWDFPEAR